MLTSVQLRQRALRRKREAIHSGEHRRETPEPFWDELFRVTDEQELAEAVAAAEARSGVRAEPHVRQEPALQ
ncbi:hypothetical protein E4L96_21270 [Massilia arenosa]|uniref:Uncharacterized protein n=1 Tax=Zemynaea arenosa TaxID=2561931 RepID=A0A4Y9RUK1_9BURK|nr:hypothetical protein [Massilia arenosa]TFW11476.1 hypothetical protein E4L96_21270 [Massilia arenosa]